MDLVVTLIFLAIASAGSEGDPLKVNRDRTTESARVHDQEKLNCARLSRRCPPGAPFLLAKDFWRGERKVARGLATRNSGSPMESPWGPRLPDEAESPVLGFSFWDRWRCRYCERSVVDAAVEHLKLSFIQSCSLL